MSVKRHSMETGSTNRGLLQHILGQCAAIHQLAITFYPPHIYTHTYTHPPSLEISNDVHEGGDHT